MPGKPWLKLYFLKDVGRLFPRRGWTLPRTIYAATGMLLLAGVLTMTVVGGIKYSARPGPPIVQPSQKEAMAPPVAAKIEPKTESAVVKSETPLSKPVIAGPPDQLGRIPVRGVVKLDFGWQNHPVFNDWRYHTGIDLSAAEGTPVCAAWAGRVSEVYQDRQYGLTVAITSGQYTVYYSALRSAAVEKDKQVGAGETIGTVGASASEPYPHLHLAIKKSDRFVNPLELMGKSD